MSSLEIQDAAAILRRGGLVAFPTETVYGLGADASNPEAVARIFAAKGRPANHPVIVHIGSVEQLLRWAMDIPPAAYQLAQHFWPGPLTLILKRQPQVSDAVTGGQNTIGLRVPGHPIALALLTAFGGGIAAPSANRFGRISPTSAAHVREELAASVDVILDGGACAVGIESTILDLSGAQPRLLRPGAISALAIEAVLGQPLATAAHDAPRVSGTLAAHYAPQTKLALIPTQALLAEIEHCIAQGERVGVLARSDASRSVDCIWQHMPADPVAYARELYAQLRALDARQLDRLLVEAPPTDADWQAVRDRLLRAAQGGGK